MAEPGTFVTTWQDKIGERWDGYFEPAKVCWKEIPEQNKETSLKRTPNSRPENLKLENVDVNNDGYPDRFELVEAGESYQIKLFRGAKTQNSSGCGGRYSISNGVGFEKEGVVVKTITKGERVDYPATHRVLITQLAWQKAKPEEKIFGRLVVSGVEVWGGVPSSEARWEVVFENCPPPVVEKASSFVGGCGL